MKLRIYTNDAKLFVPQHVKMFVVIRFEFCLQACPRFHKHNALFVTLTKITIRHMTNMEL